MFTSNILLCLSLCSFLALFSVSSVAVLLPTSPLTVGFYYNTCPYAEATIKGVVKSAISKDPGLGAALIRMHSHDCFVRGCDASILLDSTPGHPTEKDHFINKPSVRGFEVIDEAKLQLEAQCPQTVSCADIIAIAASESAYQLGGVSYAVQSGRRDGQHSLEKEPLDNLPSPFSNLELLKENFQRKGLSLEDMVVLSGAHSIGVSHCSSFSTRLFPSNTSDNSDEPVMDPDFARVLRSRCPKPSNNASSGADNTTIFEDIMS
uniref:peroxidase n=1 Tax=Chenopodium quinoa TaxID=63459 RepID=A0A803M9R8_CHEQI